MLKKNWNLLPISTRCTLLFVGLIIRTSRLNMLFLEQTCEWGKDMPEGLIFVCGDSFYSYKPEVNNLTIFLRKY